MKIALYIADGLEQIILTPTDDAEKAILAKLVGDDLAITVRTGQFYAGRDGILHSAPAGYGGARDSTYLFLRRPTP